MKYGIPPFKGDEASFLQQILERNDTTEVFLYIIDGNQVVACLYAFLNQDIVHEKPTGYIGMYDCVEDYEVHLKIMTAAINFLKDQKCAYIVGPIDQDIWASSYRFMTSGYTSKPLVSEPRNHEYYPKFWQQLGFKESTKWTTQKLDKRSQASLISELESEYAVFQELGYHAEQITTENEQQIIKDTYELMVASYQQFPLYSRITFDRFKSLYDRLSKVLDKDGSWFLYNPSGQFLGFVLSYQDLYKKLYAMKGNYGFLSKLNYLCTPKQSTLLNIAQGGTVPYFVREALLLSKQQQLKPLRLGGIGLYLALKNAAPKYEEVVVSLMREAAPIKNYAMHIASTSRTYAIYSYHLK